MGVATLRKAHSIFPSVCKGRWNGEGNAYTDRQRLAWQLAVVTELLSEVTYITLCGIESDLFHV